MSGFKLYFAQHGLAVDKADDPERPLSAAGTEQTYTVAENLQEAAIPVAQIFHSGKLRASQTARIFASSLKVETVSSIDLLSPNDDVKQFTQSLTVENALYIGHLPHLEKLIAFLVTGNEDNNIIHFQNSAVVCLEKTDESYRLRWYLTPELAIPELANK